jgi:DNA-directed RNA polymerase subunit beta
MAYSYTERKRIRKSFGSRDSVLEVPYLLQMQKDAYTAFLQADVSPKKRTIEGCRRHLTPHSRSSRTTVLSR